MEPIITGIIAALVAGATAKAKDVASEAVKDAYEGLKTLVVRKLGGKTGAIQSVEDEPESEPAQSNLAIAVSKTDADSDPEIQKLVEQLTQAMSASDQAGRFRGADIDIAAIRAGVDANIAQLKTTGQIKIKGVTAKGSVSISDLSAGSVEKKR